MPSPAAAPALRTPHLLVNVVGDQLALDGQGNIYMTDGLNARVSVFTSDGQPVSQWGTEGDGPGQLNHPGGLFVDHQANVYVADTYNHRIRKFKSTGEFLEQWGHSGGVQVAYGTPNDVAIDEQGNMYVTDGGTGGGRVGVLKLSPDGQATTLGKSYYDNPLPPVRGNLENSIIQKELPWMDRGTSTYQIDWEAPLIAPRSSHHWASQSPSGTATTPAQWALPSMRMESRMRHSKTGLYISSQPDCLVA
jgi:hypothetical protein